MAKAKIDSIDCKILEQLQRNADLQISDLAEAVGLSQTRCWRWVQRLKEASVIKGNVTLLDLHQLNVGVTVFVTVRASTHTQAWFDRFAGTVEAIPEVVEYYRMSADLDYLLCVVVPDIAAYGLSPLPSSCQLVGGRYRMTFGSACLVALPLAPRLASLARTEATWPRRC
ncbi:Lrp/AsnC family transcriptional regulator [Paucibacter sp. PLA-PC-4]|uniref:Lrp/AsnC family transcriptional regulator n=1 Tax=Paucibacter sp. PLA-PC-4 TaxID=2993655 RepID=UPI00224B4D6E|nr:Lrp/AsnC family transcriptional regulator [Paucibacter sp. PLA-PC-4]MCX2863722.1 Lrp/AsnC family transcriptional regulator [Paucibacter sp. PLA-PC-4]